MNAILGIGTAAGLVSGLLFSVPVTGSPLAFILYIVAPLPILLAALGWHHAAGLVATVVGSILVAIVFTPRAGLVFGGLIGLNSWWYAYLALLARGEEGHPEWYPVGRLLFWVAAISAGVTLLLSILVGGTYEGFVEAFVGPLREMQRLSPDLFETFAFGGKPLTPEEMAQRFALLAPFASAAVSFTTAVLLLWAAGRITVSSGRLPRPWPWLPGTALPMAALGALAAAVVGTVLFGDWLGLAARALAGSLVLAYSLQGLAVIHALTLGMAARGGILGVAYVLIFVLPGWPLLFYAALGIAEALFGFRARRNRSGPPAGNPST
jgi:hypothetical protein